MEKNKKSAIPTILNEDNTPPEQLSAFERWELPAMDDNQIIRTTGNPYTSEDIPAISNSVDQAKIDDNVAEDEIKPLTADDLEQIRQAAYDEGKEQGKSEGYEEGHKEGYDQGYKSGESDLKAAVARLAQISRVLLEPIPQQDNELEAAILELVENISTRVVRRELILDSSSVLIVIREALSCLNAGAKRVRVHLNPTDAEFVKQSLTDAGEMEEGWQILAHPTISPGGCIVDTDTSVIDVRAEKRLATVIKQVYEKDQKALEETSQAHSGLSQMLGEIDAFQEDSDDTTPENMQTPNEGSSDSEGSSSNEGEP